MVGSLDTHDDLCEHLAHYTGHTVLSVHYRRTPENPFPQLWMMPRPCCNGCIRCVACCRLRAKRCCSVVIVQVAIWPWPPPSAPCRCLAPASTDSGPAAVLPCLLPGQDNASMRSFAQGYGLTDTAMHQYWQALGGEAEPLRTPACAPRHCRCCHPWSS